MPTKVVAPGARLKTRNTAKVRLDIAKYLMARYAPNCELIVARIGERGALYLKPAESEEPNTIVWHPRQGLTVLLHEIGHQVTLARMSPLSDTREMCILEEAVAWWWAEWAAWKENLWFDYTLAEKCFELSTGRFPLAQRWRRGRRSREEEGEWAARPSPSPLLSIRRSSSSLRYGRSRQRGIRYSRSKVTRT